MKTILIFLTTCVLLFASEKTVLERHMNFDTKYYTKAVYEKSFFKELHRKNEDIADNVNLKDLRFLLRDMHITKNDFSQYKKLSLSKRYTHIRDVLKDRVFVRYMTKEDKTTKLSLFIDNRQKAIAEYLGGDNRCLWSTKYLLVLKHNILEIYQIGGFTGEYAPILLVPPEHKIHKDKR